MSGSFQFKHFPAELLPQFIQGLPKVDLHCHLIGAIPEQLIAQLAEKHSVPLPCSIEALFEFSEFDRFIQALRLAATVLRAEEDFAEVGYQVLKQAHQKAGVVHLELMFNPQYHLEAGVSYREMVDGLISGLERAAAELGVSYRLIAALDRIIARDQAEGILSEIIANPRQQVAGIGLDGPEGKGPPQLFAWFYQQAKAAGLRCTAHVCEDNQSLIDAPAKNYEVCKELLACDRFDHGYNLLHDSVLLNQAVLNQDVFNVCSVTSVVKNRARRLAAIKAMYEQGLKLTINTDDPAMFKTDMCHSLAILCDELAWGPTEVVALTRNAIDASWASSERKSALHDLLGQYLKRYT
ncbi:adenosine deaminase [Halioxenophilus sp. WMMB6]|uniref:adenosine deaminase n=1 Tax=Halioxenophilus sp. WMMB6 TaxID=3073815 RepID=UPI00295F0078|nr:adenosine deaminase [Halioxenophilus sp. WMMB6]